MFCDNCGGTMDIVDYTISVITGMVEGITECKDCELITIGYYTQEDWNNIIDNFDK